MGLPGLGPDVSVSGALIMEVLMTFFLVMVIFGTVVDPRGPKAIAPLAIGLIITMDILTGGRITGAAMNPARALGPAIVQQDFTNWWIYWVGPIIGGLIAAFAYKSIWLGDGRVRLPAAAWNRKRRAPSGARGARPRRLKRAAGSASAAPEQSPAVRTTWPPRSAPRRLPVFANGVSDLFVLAARGQRLPNSRLEYNLVKLGTHAVDDLPVERLVGLDLAVEGSELGATFSAESAPRCLTRHLRCRFSHGESSWRRFRQSAGWQRSSRS